MFRNSLAMLNAKADSGAKEHDDSHGSKRITATTTPAMDSSATTDSNRNTAEAQQLNDFIWSAVDEPHASRRKEILAKYPEIKELFGHDPKMKYVTLLVISIQLSMAKYVAPILWSYSTLSYFVAIYVVSGTFNHMLMLAMHELSHNLGFKRVIHNKLFGLVSNFPTMVPSFISFKRYHMEHHRYQGWDGVDVDIPTITEGRVFNTTFKKFFFILFQIFFYALRPSVVNPKRPGLWEGINVVSCLTFDTVIWIFWGPHSFFYLLLGSLLGTGLHPVAGHFISEHYVFDEGVETYSYYGILNIFAYNVGFHNEHHDFPYVAGKNLPKVRRIASEYYDSLPQCHSWVKVLYDYITNPNVGAFSRVKRNKNNAGTRVKKEL